MNVNDKIEQCARDGLSMTSTASKLGISMNKVRWIKQKRRLSFKHHNETLATSAIKAGHAELYTLREFVSRFDVTQQKARAMARYYSTSFKPDPDVETRKLKRAQEQQRKRHKIAERTKIEQKLKHCHSKGHSAREAQQLIDIPQHRFRYLTNKLNLEFPKHGSKAHKSGASR